MSAQNRQVCFWVKIQSLTSSSSIDSLVEFAKINNYTTIFAQVRSRGDAAYNSIIVPKYDKVNPVFDPLKYLLKSANSAGIQIHAWLNMYVIWTRHNPSVPYNHIYNQSDWIDSAFNGLKGNNNIYLSPTHPAVNNYLISVIREIISNYDVDGIHLDYIRFKDENYGSNIESMKAFKNWCWDKKGITFTNEDVRNDIQSKLKKEWNQFKRNAVTSLVKRTEKLLYDLNPDISLSVAVKPNIIEAKSRFSQDWGFWLRHRLVDFVVPMNYTAENSIFTRDLKIMKSRLPEPIHEKIIMGVGCYNQDSKSAADKIQLVIQNGFGGISLFAYDTHKHDPAWFNSIHEILN